MDLSLTSRLQDFYRIVSLDVPFQFQHSVLLNIDIPRIFCENRLFAPPLDETIGHRLSTLR